MRKQLFRLLIICSLSSLSADPLLASYIEQQAGSFGLDPRFVNAILVEENSLRDPEAININEDGSRDLGLFQLNEKYLPEFIGRYWNKPYPFNWKNPFHSAYLGMAHLVWLYGFGFNSWQVAIAYNCGYYRVLSDPYSVPNRSIDYAARVYTRAFTVRVGRASWVEPNHRSQLPPRTIVANTPVLR